MAVRREYPDFDKIRRLQVEHDVTDKDLAMAAGYGGRDPVKHLRDAERKGYWKRGGVAKLKAAYGWDQLLVPETVAAPEDVGPVREAPEAPQAVERIMSGELQCRKLTYISIEF